MFDNNKKNCTLPTSLTIKIVEIMNNSKEKFNDKQLLRVHFAAVQNPAPLFQKFVCGLYNRQGDTILFVSYLN